MDFTDYKRYQKSPEYVSDVARFNDHGLKIQGAVNEHDSSTINTIFEEPINTAQTSLKITAPKQKYTIHLKPETGMINATDIFSAVKKTKIGIRAKTEKFDSCRLQRGGTWISYDDAQLFIRDLNISEEHNALLLKAMKDKKSWVYLYQESRR